MGSFLFKPIGQGQIGGGAANFLIENTNLVSGGFYDSQGNLVERFGRAQGIPEPGQSPGVKFYASKPGYAYGQDLVAKFTDKAGKVYTFNLPQGGQRYEGDFNNPTSLKAVDKGPMGPGGAFAPGQMGFSAFPSYLGGMFPSPVLGSYTPAQTAPYTFTDPIKYAQEFGAFNRGEIQKNFDQSKDLALKELDTELSSLRDFVPAAAALKRQEISVDNQFNQAQRAQQVNQALPGAAQALEGQTARAQSYANGRIPNAVEDRAYELGIRSAAADQAAGGGFGAQSSVARKASDLLSVSQRINLSKYGDQLLSGSINQRAGLLLAPTEYSNAGGQVQVNPSLSSSQLINSNLNAINGLTTITPSTGLQTTVGQNQFVSSLKQQTNLTNAQNQLQLSEFNANAQNSFALDQFGYNAGYANSLAGASQNNINTQFQLGQQQQFQQLLSQYMDQAQGAGTLQSILSAVPLLTGGASGNSPISGIANFGSGLFSGLVGKSGPQTSGAGEKGLSAGSGISSAVSGVGNVLSGIGGALGF